MRPDGASWWAEARRESRVRRCLPKRSFRPGGGRRGGCWYVWGAPPPSPHAPRWISIMHRAPVRNSIQDWYKVSSREYVGNPQPGRGSLAGLQKGHAVANARTYARRQVKAAKYKRAIDMWIQSYKYRYINHIQETNVSLTIHTQNMRTHERVIGLGGIWDGRVDQHKSHFENRCSTFHICHSLYPDIYTSEWWRMQ